MSWFSKMFGSQVQRQDKRISSEIRYGDDRTIHKGGEVSVETYNGKVVAVWFRCAILKFAQTELTDQSVVIPVYNGLVEQRVEDMRLAYENPDLPPIKAIIFEVKEE